MLKTVVIGYVWPEPKSSAAGQNMLSILKSCHQAGFELTFLTAATDSDHKADLASLGVTCQQVALNCSSFDHLIKKINPDIVIFDRYMTEEQFSWRVKESCPNAVRILNTEDLHSLRQARHDSVKRNGDALAAELNTDLSQREVASILRSDLTLVISHHELHLLTDHYRVPPKQLYYSPLPIQKHVSELPTFENRSHFIHIGNFRHAPNWDAVLQLKQHIWPAIKSQLPDAELHIYGSYLPKKAMQLHNSKQGFLIKGWADNACEVMSNAKILISPIRFGAGIKGKLLDAMVCKTPSITTWVGAEGIIHSDEAHHTWPGKICPAVLEKEGAVEEFVSAAVNLYSNYQSWLSESEKSEFVLKRFVENVPKATLTDMMLEIANNIDVHRKPLFLQGLVWHQTLTATKYMSQWIEAKNKN